MIFSKRNLIFKHTCELPREVGHDLITSPYASFIQKFCFRLRRYITIYKNHKSSQFFRSNASFMKEKKRHLTTESYRYVIHPFSPFAMIKKIIVCFLWLITLIVDPFLGTFVAKGEKNILGHHPLQFSIYIFIQILLTVDMVSRFFVGYVVEKTRQIVLVPKDIVKNYLFSYFLVDFLPIIPVCLLLLYPGLPSTYEFIIYQLRMVRFIRVKSMVENLHTALSMAGLSEPTRVVIALCILALLMTHVWTCLLAFAPLVHKFLDIPYTGSWLVKLRETLHNQVRVDQEKLTVYHDYLQHATLVVCHFFGADAGRYRTDNSVEWLFLSLLLVQGLCYYIYAIGRITQLFGMINIAESKYEELVSQVEEYMLRKKIPRKLRKRIKLYYDYKFDKTFFSEQLILHNMSEHLRMEVLLYSCRNLVEKVQLLKGLSKAAVGCILVLLKQEVFLPGDIVMRSNQSASALYFILYGTCAVVLESGHEVMHIEDGHHFGGEKQLMGWVYNVVALEPSVIYSLSKQDMDYCCKNYPEIAFKLGNISKSRSLVITSNDSQTDVKTDIILAELRRGNILEHGRERGIYLS